MQVGLGLVGDAWGSLGRPYSGEYDAERCLPRAARPHPFGSPKSAHAAFSLFAASRQVVVVVPALSLVATARCHRRRRSVLLLLAG